MSVIEYVPLKDCCKVVGGATPKRNIPEYWGNGVPWVTPKDVSNLETAILEDAPEYISKEGYKSCSTYLLPIDSILLTSRAPIGNVAIAGREMCTNQGFKSLVPNKNVDSSFLYHCIKYMSPQLQALGNGATFKEVSKKVVESFKIPLPPLPEQKRIAAILDKADAIRRKRQLAIEKSEDFLRAVFLNMFGDPVTNPKGWKKAPISEFVSQFDSGKNVKPDETPGPHTKYFILKVSAVTWGDYRHEESKPLPSDYEPPLSYFVKSDDLLISRANTQELIGATAYVRETPENIVLPDKIWRFIWQEPKIVDPLYVHAMFTHPAIRAEISKRSTGTSGSMKNISKSKLMDIEVPCPPLKNQVMFAKQVQKTWHLLDRMKRHLKQSNNLFESLTQLAFRGELTNQAADELLEAAAG